MTVDKSDKNQAFELEAIPYMGILHNYAMGMTRNPSDADDLVQDTYLKAYRFWDKYEEGSNIRAWLFRILKNTFINRYRQTSKEPENVSYDSIKEFYQGLQPASLDLNEAQASLFENLLDDHVTKAVSSLPEAYRTSVILCDMEGLSYGEIAEFLDCPLGTVRSRVHRGRMALHEKLHRYAKERGYLSSV